jgi:hypothetical protein
MPKNILDLKTLQDEFYTVTIDGVEFRLRSFAELGLLDLNKISRAGTALVELQTKDMSDASEEELTDILSILELAIRVAIPDLSEETLARLNDGQKLDIANAFLQVSGVISTPMNRTQKRSQRKKPTLAK